ncbi:MAG: hypothetical protein ABIH42_07515, partial [Planctomycetota bacterium]
AAVEALKYALLYLCEDVSKAAAEKLKGNILLYVREDLFKIITTLSYKARYGKDKVYDKIQNYFAVITLLGSFDDKRAKEMLTIIASDKELSIGPRNKAALFIKHPFTKEIKEILISILEEKPEDAEDLFCQYCFYNNRLLSKIKEEPFKEIIPVLRDYVTELCDYIKMSNEVNNTDSDFWTSKINNIIETIGAMPFQEARDVLKELVIIYNPLNSAVRYDYITTLWYCAVEQLSKFDREYTVSLTMNILLSEPSQETTDLLFSIMTESERGQKFLPLIEGDYKNIDRFVCETLKKNISNNEELVKAFIKIAKANDFKILNDYRKENLLFSIVSNYKDLPEVQDLIINTVRVWFANRYDPIIIDGLVSYIDTSSQDAVSLLKEIAKDYKSNMAVKKLAASDVPADREFLLLMISDWKKEYDSLYNEFCVNSLGAGQDIIKMQSHYCSDGSDYYYRLENTYNTYKTIMHTAYRIRDVNEEYAVIVFETILCDKKFQSSYVTRKEWAKDAVKYANPAIESILMRVATDDSNEEVRKAAFESLEKISSLYAENQEK